MFAVWYLHSPEGQRIVAAWEQRALFAGVGVLAAYILLRQRSSRGPSVHASSVWRTALRLVAGGVMAAGLWLAVDLLRGEDFLGELWVALPPQHENAVKALGIVVCGWAGWAVAFSELLRRLAGYRPQGQAEPTVAPDGVGHLGSPSGSRQGTAMLGKTRHQTEAGLGPAGGPES